MQRRKQGFRQVHVPKVVGEHVQIGTAWGSVALQANTGHRQVKRCDELVDHKAPIGTWQLWLTKADTASNIPSLFSGYPLAVLRGGVWPGVPLALRLTSFPPWDTRTSVSHGTSPGLAALKTTPSLTGCVESLREPCYFLASAYSPLCWPLLCPMSRFLVAPTCCRTRVGAFSPNQSSELRH